MFQFARIPDDRPTDYAYPHVLAGVLADWETVMKLLHIDSSILGDGSASRELTREIVARWTAAHPETEVMYLDLAAEALPHLSQKSLSPSEELEAARNATALEQFLAADVSVIGAPVYNFTIPTQLKAWIDRITVAGKTFRYTANGPEGLAGNKEVIVAVARGGGRAAGASRGFGEPFLEFPFGFLRLHKIRFFLARGLSHPPEHP